jgi:hypothetical protein
MLAALAVETLGADGLVEVPTCELQLATKAVANRPAANLEFNESECGLVSELQRPPNGSIARGLPVLGQA